MRDVLSGSLRVSAADPLRKLLALPKAADQVPYLFVAQIGRPGASPRCRFPSRGARDKENACLLHGSPASDCVDAASDLPSMGRRNPFPLTAPQLASLTLTSAGSPVLREYRVNVPSDLFGIQPDTPLLFGHEQRTVFPAPFG